MSVAVIIPTVDRPDALRRALEAVHGQTLQPAVVVVCPPDADKLPDDVRRDARNTVIDGVKGLTSQRNLAASVVPEDVEYIAYFDDDAVPRSDYLARAVAVLDANPDVVGLTGKVARDGAAEARELSATEIEAALAGSWASDGRGITAVKSLYGCNMVLRAQAVRQVKFDERLPLYGWLEDLDFSRRAAASLGARLVKDEGAVIVHQGSASGGRTQHRRLGYSQVTNVAYLFKKGSIGVTDLPLLLGKPVLATAVRAVVGPESGGRRDRALGMAKAASDIARGRLTPERITEL